MAYNVFQQTETEYQLLMRDYPGLITLAISGARLARQLSTWDVESIALIERLAYVEWRLLDTVYSLFRDKLGVEGNISLQQLRQGWRALWLASVRQLVDKKPSHTLRFIDGASDLLDQLEIDFRTTVPTLTADTWIDMGRKLVLSLRESALG